MEGQTVTEELSHYKSRGARALVLLHEKHLRECLDVWKQAKAVTVRLPETDDKNYESLETLLEHILGAPRGYLAWVCKQLELPDPHINPVPEASAVEAEADSYLEHLLERWRLPLEGVEEEKLYNPEYPSNGGTHHHCIDIMLQHAVMHPVRHAFQLRELMQKQAA